MHEHEPASCDTFRDSSWWLLLSSICPYMAINNCVVLWSCSGGGKIVRYLWCWLVCFAALSSCSSCFCSSLSSSCFSRCGCWSLLGSRPFVVVVVVPHACSLGTFWWWWWWKRPPGDLQSNLSIFIYNLRPLQMGFFGWMVVTAPSLFLLFSYWLLGLAMCRARDVLKLII